MIIRELERSGGVIVEAMQARQAESDRTRPAGLHLSTIINDFVNTLYPEPTRQETAARQKHSLFELGDIIEDVIAEELSRRSTHWEKPKPRKFEGIWCSPDGWSPRIHTIDEMKSTRISCRQVVIRPDGRVDGLEEHKKLLKHVIQIKCYMHVWDAKRGRLHELFLNGDWKPPFPDPRTFILRPESSRELRDTWDQMKEHAHEREML